MTEYTAADFANARFAEHPDGDFAARVATIGNYPWIQRGRTEWSDAEMARDGWVPVPTKPTITESEYRELMDSTSVPYGVGFTDGFHRAGGEVIPDPEPTNTELWAAFVGEFGIELLPRQAARLAAWMDKHGITATNVKDN